MAKPKGPALPSRLLLAAALLALGNALWSLFLWQQLLLARRGGDPFCALGGGGCAALWDGAFASGVHALTGLPVAAWGVAWSAAALVLALLAWQRGRAGRELEPFWSGVVLMAVGGAGGVVALFGASFAAHEFCSNCAITYLLVAAFAAVVFIATGSVPPRAWVPGGASAGAAMLAGFLLLLMPGLATPRAGDHLGTAAIGDVGDDPLAAVRSMIDGLSAEEMQILSNARAYYAEARPVDASRPRALVGSPDATIRITTFTDSGCGHCGSFHVALEELLKTVPPGTIAVDQRVFPLDGSCNSRVPARGREEVCLAAQVRVCLEDDPRSLELTGWLHHDAAPLELGTIYRVAERLAPRTRIEACVASQETADKIRDDIELGIEAGLSGTPFILVNGRPAMPYMPFLYAMALTDADPDHEVFAGLPAPTPGQPGHEGHMH